ncbi:MAG: polysaccharide pyruvyl transferase family protein [Salinivirgaceae bacterium]|nr:polysaccharide pyruvyl transferase family protein [Salinivirgaceae bacterium]
MNIKVITRHGPSNYGSLLQSIATIKALENLGHTAKIIDYQRKDERGLSMVLTQLQQKARFSNPLKKLAYILIRYPIEKYAQVKFDKMRKRWLKMTKRISCYESLRDLDADLYMTGSDQVWGPTMNGHYDKAYFLDFVKDGRKKVSYAGSFGKTKFDADTEKAYKEMLSKYDKIAVREDSAVMMMQDWGLSNCVGQVLDPTLLLNKEEWGKILITKNTDDKYRGKKYILLYLIHNYPEHSAYALRFAKAHNMELIRVNPFLHQAHNGGRFICCPDVSEFLALIKNATYMLTDSFHGTCFAINLNVQFVELLPLNATSARNQSILELTNLKNRIVSDYEDYEAITSHPIEYDAVNMILRQERSKSTTILRSLIE